ncbi:MAG: type II secretion system protein GspG [Deltaproteobacteria bacterium]|nr:type II secretion system protein GspG [Deltaproteobacteria bacterium]
MMMLRPLLIGLLLTSGCGKSSIETMAAEAEVDATHITLRRVGDALDMHFARKRDYPESLAALVESKHLTIEQTRDAWKRELRFTPSGRKFTLCSDGPDGKPGTADDLCLEPTAR